MPNTVINFDLSELSGVDPETTNLTAARIDFSPYSAYEITDGEWLTRAILHVRLPNGTGTATLPPPPTGNAYEVQERGWRGARRGYVIFADVPEVNWSDPTQVIWVDKDTLDPTAPPSPAWLAALNTAVPLGGTTGQVLAKASDADHDDVWVDQTGGGGGGAVSSVNAKTGAVVLTQDDIGDGTTAKQYTATDKTKLSGIATGATANSSDATLLARANHTGTESADVLTDGTTNKAFLATERTKLTGIATGATANSADVTLLARANHTGTQTASTISDFSTAADARVVAGITGKADTASPTFTGDPKAPTPTAGDNDTSIATTAFVTSAVTASKLTGVYNLTDYGTVDITGATNSNTAWNAMIAAWYAGGGGRCQLPLGTILVTTQTALPSGNPSTTGMLRQPPMVLCGVGGHAAGQKSDGSGGTRLNLTYQGGATPAALTDAKIQTFGSGSLILRDIVFTDSTSSSSTPFFYTTGTTIHADESVAFLGATGNTGLTVQQDAFILGGTTAFPVAPVYPATPNYGTIDAPFQGYGSSFEGVYFNRIRHVVHARMYANQIVINKCFIDKDCGSNLSNDAPIYFDGTPHATLSGTNSANVITGNYIEIGYYKYAVKLKSASTNYIAGNGAEDPVGGLFAAVVRMESANISGTDYPSVNNTIIGNLNGGGGATMVSEDTLSANHNFVFAALGSDTSTIPSKINVGGNTLGIPSSAVFTIQDLAGGAVLAFQPGTGSGPLANFSGPVTLVGTSGNASSTALTIGNNSTAADSTLIMNAPSGKTNQMQWKRAGVQTWLFYDANSTSFFFRDPVNSKMHMTFNPGSGTGGSTEFNSAVKIIGNVGFYNTTPIAKQTLAAAATDAATTQTLANDIRTKLIALGLTA